jgi:hypothetical protein
LEEFILGSNGTGLVENGAFVDSSSAAVTQMVNEDVIPGTTVISYGAGGTASSTVVPSATVGSFSLLPLPCLVMIDDILFFFGS